MSVILVRDKDCGEIDFSGWGFDTEASGLAQTLAGELTKSIVGTMQRVFETEPLYAGIPRGGEFDGPEHPLILYVDLPLGPSQCDYVQWHFPLRDAVMDVVESNSNFQSGLVDDEDGKRILTGVANALHALADEVAAKVAP